MISLTQIRKAFKLAVYDPKQVGSEWNIQARDMTPISHIARAKQLLTYYLEGVQQEEALLGALWHLACSVAKLELKYDKGIKDGESL